MISLNTLINTINWTQGVQRNLKGGSETEGGGGGAMVVYIFAMAAAMFNFMTKKLRNCINVEYIQSTAMAYCTFWPFQTLCLIPFGR